MKPKVSVIVPVYNAERYLEESLGGIVKQTLKDIEIICVDDGSSDGSLKILNRFADLDGRISIITRPHKNAGAARNVGLAEAKGEYLSFLDADDMFEPDMLEKAYMAAEEKKAEIVVFRSDRFNVKTGAYEEARWTIKSELLPEKYKRGETFSRKDMDDILYCFSAGWAWDKLFSSNYISGLGLRFQEQPWINDRCFVMCAIAAAERIYVVDDVLAHKRINNAGALTTGYTDGGHWQYLSKCLIEIKKWLSDSGLFEDLKADFYAFAIFHLRWNIDQFLDSELFDKVFSEIRDVSFCDLEIDKLSKHEILKEEDRWWLELINNNPAEAYRFERNLTRKSGSYLFPFELVPKGSSIILYGAGAVGQEFYRQANYSGWCEIVLWVDRVSKKGGDFISDIKEIFTVTYDYIVIAIRDKIIAEGVIADLISRDVAAEKIVWRAPEIEL